MTRAQQRDPGRFVTPASSFISYAEDGDYNKNQAPLSCGGVPPQERATVDPYQFITSDMSFRLPLVGSLTDDSFCVVKKQKCHNDEMNDDLQKNRETSTGRKTIQVDATALMPTMMSLDQDDTNNYNHDDNDSSSSPVPLPHHEPPPKPILFGRLKRESRCLVRPNITG